MLRDSHATIASFVELATWATEIRMAYAWASTQGGVGQHWRALPLAKVTRAIIGTHFLQTEPAAIAALMNEAPGRLRVVSDSGGVFHPKVIVGLNGSEVRAIVGSSNLTGGGFGGNTELNVLLIGTTSDTAIADLLRFLDEAWTHPRVFEPTAEWLARYTEAYVMRPRPPLVPSGVLPASEVTSERDLDVDWDRYVALIRSQERRQLANGHRIRIFDHEDWSYLQEIEQAGLAYARYGSLTAMPGVERRQAAGLGTRARYLGSMSGAGYYKQLIIDDPAELSGALDLIPLTGPVDDETITIVIDAMLALRGVDLGTATRLLSVRRPDIFLSLNNASRSRIRAIFEASPTTERTYLKLLHRIWALPWYTSPEPSDVHERRMWRARVALVDAILYEQSESGSETNT